MRKLIWPVLFLLLLLLRGAGSALYTGWLSFDLTLVLLYSYALLRGRNCGAAAGAGTGLLQDAMTVGIFGFHMLTRTAVGYVVGMTKAKVVSDKYSYHIAAVGACSLAIRVLLGVVEFARTGGSTDFLAVFAWNSAGYCVGNMLLTIPVLLAAQKIDEWICEEDISY